MANTRAKLNSTSKRLGKLLSKHWLWLFLFITLLAIAVRFVGITKSSIWHDEGFSVMLSSRGWLDVWLGSARDVHPPLYYELLHGWSLIFGSSALASRSLSAIFGVIVVGLGYLVTLKISKKYNIAALAGIILALNPFLVRYSQEARMYGVLGVFVLIAILGLIRIVTNHKDKLGYLLYIVGVSAGLYTHYFMVLVVASFWVYLLSIYFATNSNKKSSIKLIVDWRWWLANITALVIFLPWLPNMIKQLTRAQGLGWLSKTSIMTFNDTIWQFVTFTDAHKIWPLVYWVVPLVVLLAIIYASHQDKTKQHFVRLLGIFCLFPIIVAILASQLKPIFHERYFVFTAIGICIVLAIAIAGIYKKHRFIAVAVAVVIIAVQLVGLRNVNSQASHRMDNVFGEINKNFKPGDKIISGELYTYFDGSFYNSTGTTMLLFTGSGRPNGYGESALIYDKNIYLDSYSSLAPGRVWLLGKTGSHTYYDAVPASWQLEESFSQGYSEVRLYQIQ